MPLLTTMVDRWEKPRGWSWIFAGVWIALGCLFWADSGIKHPGAWGFLLVGLTHIAIGFAVERRMRLARRADV